jgi:hypothetical protein
VTLTVTENLRWFGPQAMASPQVSRVLEITVVPTLCALKVNSNKPHPDPGIAGPQ